MNFENDKVAISVDYINAFNYTFYQNRIGLINSISIENKTTRILEAINIKISSPSPAIKGSAVLLGDIGALSFHNSNKFNIELVPSYFVEMTEKEMTTIDIEINEGDQSLLSFSLPIDLLPINHWAGSNILPELLATYVTPNHPFVSNILQKSADILNKWSDDSSLTGYFSGDYNKVLLQVVAIFQAIKDLDLIYCVAPASFEIVGQKLRLIDQIVQDKMANCIDISLLTAACLEAIGLNPLIIMTKGHAFVGCWLHDETFNNIVQDDVTMLSKRLVEGMNEIIVFEGTAMNRDSGLNFEEAKLLAIKNLYTEQNFELFIDIKRARNTHILPLPSKSILKSPDGLLLEVTKAKEDQRFNKLSPQTIIPESAIDKISSKQQVWERKLLDLSLRNDLLSIKGNRTYIYMMTTELSFLEDSLCQKKQFVLLPKPKDWQKDLKMQEILTAQLLNDPQILLANKDVHQLKLTTYLLEDELATKIVKLYRNSRLSIEEHGSNTLFLALGLLEWYESNSSTIAKHAPILLVPVELVKNNSKIGGYVLKTNEEETQINVTLLEYLKQKFDIQINGLETLPTDENGVDIQTIFNIIRHHIKDVKRWDVLEQSILGNFSFNKFILWQDIRNNQDQLKENKIVSSLIDGKLNWEVIPTNFEDTDFDITYKPGNIALPISTDSSQFEAIIKSDIGESFVLHGPPGTGKSQTITNIIANALYHNKRVLFVAAKKAALDVVHNRLTNIGIGNFCLELHSNKVKKSEVLTQLSNASLMGKRRGPESFEAEAEKLYLLKTKLSETITAIHKPEVFGLSLYEVISQYSELSHLQSSIIFKHQDIQFLTPERLNTWNELIKDIATVVTICGSPVNHPLTGVKTSYYTNNLKEQIQTNIEQLVATITILEQHIEKFRDQFQIEQPLENLEQLIDYKHLINLFTKLDNIPASFFDKYSNDMYYHDIIDLTTKGVHLQNLRNELLVENKESILELDAQSLLSEWMEVSDKWFLPKWFGQNKLVKRLKLISQNTQVTKDNFESIVQKVIDYQKSVNTIEQETTLLKSLNFLYKNHQTDWQKISINAQLLLKINQIGTQLFGVQNLANWRHNISASFSEGSQALLQSQNNHFEALLKSEKQFYDLQETIRGFIGSNWYQQQEESIFEVLKKEGQRLLLHIDRLKDWHQWTQIKEKAENVKLDMIIHALENNNTQGVNLINDYSKALYKAMGMYAIDNNPQLANFNSKLFEEEIQKFKNLERNFQELTQLELKARLSTKVPNMSLEAAKSSEVGILQKAIRSNGRGMSIRKLFDQIPDLLTRLSPCMLMSPLSVSQYFEANTDIFDLVIFDEASQLPTSEAVGAMARAKNVIVVGDPKQMPPTSFFSNNQMDEEDAEIDDLESILDDCLALSMPSQHLSWHYRSKHESLIAFSNIQYYDAQLLTFPSVDDLTSKVTAVEVPGFYDKGKTRQNQFEAKAIVDEIIYRLKDPILQQKSIGVVTFSVVQQNLIEDLLNKAFAEQPELEAIALKSAEPIFIKNLENVQGDERDIILFSICYGPDKDGNVSLNFGPLNRKGGWRRLNVAVSRARYEMKIFKTIKSEQIDLNRSNAEGIAGLKAFLQFAERGKLSTAITHNQAQNRDLFKLALIQEIQNKGYKVNTDIGRSNYKIDIGIVNPKDPNQYLLAILLDSKHYYNAKTMNDREVVQTSVLKALGWNIHRVWSIDWWENKEKVVADIITLLEQPVDMTVQDLQSLRTQNEGQKRSNLITPNLALEVPENTLNITDNQDRVHVNDGFSHYQITNLNTQTQSGSMAFLNVTNKELIKRSILSIINTEAPITDSLLTTRLLNNWNIGRSGARINHYVEQLIAELNLLKTTNHNQIVYWHFNQNADDYIDFRSAQSLNDRRDIEDIPKIEISNAIYYLLQQSLSIDEEELYKMLRSLFGFNRMSPSILQTFETSIAIAFEKGFVRKENERIILM